MKNNIKKITLGILVILAMGCLSGCCLSHNWQEATCTTPRTCTKCGETEGEALGHEWQDATCTTAETCKVCGTTQGNSLGHEWQEATCTMPQTCTVCLTTTGGALGHEWQEATCTTPRTCTKCRETEGEASGHMLNPGGFCLYCDELFGKEITESNFDDYFKITCDNNQSSPTTYTVSPKYSGFTYSGGTGNTKPYVYFKVEGCRKGRNGYDTVVFKDTVCVTLDEKGYGKAKYTWSNTGADALLRLDYIHDMSTYTVGIYYYEEK